MTLGMTASYDIKPGVGVGPFQLGDSLWAVLELLRTRKNEYPKVDVAWDDEAPASSGIIVHIPHISLYFPYSPTQHLELIRLPSVNSSSSRNLSLAGESRCNLTYDGGRHVLASKRVNLTRGVVGRVLGPTYAAQGVALEYPGASFVLEPGIGGSAGRDDVVKAIDVKPNQAQAGPSRIWRGIRGCRIKPGKGVSIELPGEEVLEVDFGKTSSQDLLLDLGPPIRRYWKEDDRMARMWGTMGGGNADDDGDCFWNYFQHGIDFLISGSGRIKRIIMHTNIPGTPLFQRHARCPWSIGTPVGLMDTSSKASDVTSALPTGLDSTSPYLAPPLPSSTPEPPLEIEQSAGALNIPNGSSSKKKKKKAAGAISGSQPGSALSSSPVNLDVDAEVRVMKEQSSGRPAQLHVAGDGDAIRGMELDRLGEGGLDEVQGQMTSRLLGFDGLIIEEDVATGAITAVTVYST